MTYRTASSALAALLLALASVSWARPPDDCGNTPLLVDTQGDGIHLGPTGVGVWFDLLGRGEPIHMQWVREGGDEAFLVADLNGNGIVDDGSELFGEGTTLILEGDKARNGFIALAQYDLPDLGGNDDGLITRADAIWQSLWLWLDDNADGISTPDEMKRPEDFGFQTFETIPKHKMYVDEAGNTIPFYAWVYRVRGKRVLMVDVYFRSLP